MDPQQTWIELSQLFTDGKLDEAKEKARDLRRWLDQQGFAPTVTGLPAFDRLVARSACNAVLQR